MVAKRTGGKKKGRKPRKAGARGAAPRESEDLLSMEEPIARLKTTRATFYRWLRAGKIGGMKVGRQWRFTPLDLERFLRGQEPKIELIADIHPFLADLTKRWTALGGDPSQYSEDDPVTRAVGLMLRLGVELRASDIHLAPHLEAETGTVIGVLRYRVDGVLSAFCTMDGRLVPAVMERCKAMASCDPRQRLRSQDGRLFVKAPEGPRVDVRVSFLPAALGETLTARILHHEAVQRLNLDRLSLADRDRSLFQKWIEAPWGLVVVTGPTGAGKTNTVYAALTHLASPTRKMMTVEDPVEVHLPWAVQVQVNEREGISFPSCLKAIFRSDPDVVYIGEIREAATLAMAQQTALTGHLVLTVLHAGDASRALGRMVELSKDPYVVGETTRCILAQRLVRTLCPDCSALAVPSHELRDRLATTAREGGAPWENLAQGFRRPVGCPACGQTGYRGRQIITEGLEVTPEIREALSRKAPIEEIEKLAVSQGMITLAASGVKLAAEGKTTLEEVARVTCLL